VLKKEHVVQQLKRLKLTRFSVFCMKCRGIMASVSKQGLTSHPTHSRSFGDDFYRIHSPTNSVNLLKDKIVNVLL